MDTNSNHSYTNLQDAVTAASPGDTLFVKGICGTSEISKNLTISGQSTSGTKTATLSGAGAGHWVLAIDSGVSVTLNTLIITGGFFGRGAGIFNIGGTVTLNGSTVTGNFAEDGGGGIWNRYGTLTLNGSTVSNNTADSQSGGGGGGITNTFGTVTMTGGSTVTGNTVQRLGDGGGILNCGGAGTLNGAVDGVNVYHNTPDNISNASPFSVC